MSLTKTRKLDKLEIVGDFKILQARYLVEVTETIGEETNVISSSNERESYTPDTDVASLPSELEKHAVLEWTDEVIAAYNEHINSTI
jgi:hypothetical protein